MAAFIEALPLAVFVSGASGRPFFANRLAQILLGKGVVPQATVDTLVETYGAFIALLSRAAVWAPTLAARRALR